MLPLISTHQYTQRTHSAGSMRLAMHSSIHTPNVAKGSKPKQEQSTRLVMLMKKKQDRHKLRIVRHQIVIYFH